MGAINDPFVEGLRKPIKLHQDVTSRIYINHVRMVTSSFYCAVTDQRQMSCDLRKER